MKSDKAVFKGDRHKLTQRANMFVLLQIQVKNI